MARVNSLFQRLESIDAHISNQTVLVQAMVVGKHQHLGMK